MSRKRRKKDPARDESSGKKVSKFKAQKTVIDGIIFDSKKEAKRYEILKDMLDGGQISNLRRQVVYELIPVQKEPDTKGPRGGLKKGKVLERACYYVADFVYNDLEGNTIVEDTKGFRTEAYIIKRKLMLYIHGIRIREV